MLRISRKRTSHQATESAIKDSDVYETLATTYDKWQYHRGVPSRRP